MVPGSCKCLSTCRRALADKGMTSASGRGEEGRLERRRPEIKDLKKLCTICCIQIIGIIIILIIISTRIAASDDEDEVDDDVDGGDDVDVDVHGGDDDDDDVDVDGGDDIDDDVAGGRSSLLSLLGSGMTDFSRMSALPLVQKAYQPHIPYNVTFTKN